jgi:hypothetical protein
MAWNGMWHWLTRARVVRPTHLTVGLAAAEHGVEVRCWIADDAVAYGEETGDAALVARLTPVQQHVRRMRDSPAMLAVAATYPDIATAFDLAFGDPALVCIGPGARPLMVSCCLTRTPALSCPVQAEEAVADLLRTTVDDAVAEQVAADVGVDYDGVLVGATQAALDAEGLNLNLGLGRLVARAVARDTARPGVVALLERFVADPDLSLDRRLEVADVAARVRVGLFPQCQTCSVTRRMLT